MADSQNNTMRLDAFLSRVRLIMPRTSAKRACDSGIVMVNNRSGKPSTDVTVNDVVSMRFTNQLLVVRITKLPGKSVAKKQADAHYTVLTNTTNSDDQGSA